MLLALPTIVVSAVYCSSLRTKMMTTPSLPAKGNVNENFLRLDMRNSYGSTRCSSRQAADILRNSSREDGLLIITCDASGRGGGSKHDGIASVLRIQHGITTTLNHVKEDLIDFVARRTVPSKTSSEVAAIALGIKRALFIVPPLQRRLVLIISDSEFALDFYCSDATVRNDERQEYVRQRTRTRMERLREDSFNRCLLSLIKETPNGVLFTRVRSSSRSVEFVGVDSANEFGESPSSWDGIGFIDHDVADHLSSIARSYANANHGEGGEIKTLLQTESLGKKDIAWLENSESVNNANKDKSSSPIKLHDKLSWQSIEVVGSEMRDNRKERNQQRKKIIEKFLGVNDSS